MLYFIVFPAEMIAEYATFAPNEQDRRAEISRQIVEIKKREGLGDDEEWRMDEGPVDYQALCLESEKLYDKVQDTVLLHVLRRYKIHDVADLYEKDRATFDLLREEGRIAVFGKEGEDS